MTFGSLFAGIGGIDLGLEKHGLSCQWQVEIDPLCREILSLRWPLVPKHDDVRTFPNKPMPRVDLIVGGFPCQDISHAGKKAGINGRQSGLWSEFHRILGVFMPDYALVENVPALRTRGLGRVLRDLAAIGYDAEWDSIPAAAVGAPFVRDRIFVVAHRSGDGRGQGWSGRLAGHVAGVRQPARGRPSHEVPGAAGWSVEPGLGRLVHGVSPAVDRLRLSGNCVVPQVAELFGVILSNPEP